MQDYRFGVLVVEAGYRSGASLTATIAKAENKKVFCVPSNINNKYTRTNELIQKGAILITRTEDILKELSIVKVKEKCNKIVHNQIEEKVIIDPKYQKIYSKISYESIHINQICKNAETDISTVSSVLTILELEGYIEQLPGKLFKLI